MSKVHTSDVRFGGTFLDVENKEKSVKGEILSDKIDGELFIKRPLDGRIVSFNQKASSTYEMIKDFNIEFVTSEGFQYPSKDCYFTGIYFDTNALSERNTGEKKVDICERNIEFPDRVGDANDFIFTVSTATNGFFFKPKLRYSDRILMGFLSGEFRELEDSGVLDTSFKTWLTENKLYGNGDIYDIWKNVEYWNESNAILMYTVSIKGINSSGEVMEKMISDMAMIRLNEHTFIKFPISYLLNMATVETVQVRINTILFPKLQFIAEQYKDGMGMYTETIKHLMTPDYKMYLKETEVFYFVDGVEQLPEEVNCTIHHLVDYEFMKQSIRKINQTMASRPFASQPEELEDSEWSLDTVWNEELRRVNSGAKAYPMIGATTTVEEVERSLYFNDAVEVELTTMESTKEGIWVQTVKREI